MNNQTVAEDLYRIRDELMYVGRKVEVKEMNPDEAKVWVKTSRDKLTALLKRLQ